MDCKSNVSLPSPTMSSTSAPTTKAWVTLLTRTSYLAGALVLHQSLQKHKSAYPLIVFATKELPLDARQVLQSKGIRVRDIEYLEPKAENKGELVEHDRRFADTWTKLRCFEMVEYEVRILRFLGVQWSELMGGNSAW